MKTAAIGLIGALVAFPGAQADVIRVSVAEGLVESPVSARLVVFFVTAEGDRWADASPVDGPFFSEPQPVASVEIGPIGAGGEVEIDTESMVAFPGPIDALTARARVQAVLDLDNTERSRTEAPGNLLSDIVTVDLDAVRDDVIDIRLTTKTSLPDLPPETPNLKWVEFRSDLLSDFYGRDIFHRAGVYIPGAIANEPETARGLSPAVYVIPGFGGNHLGAARMAEFMEQVPNAPSAVWIELDPESPTGHHGFVDSPNHGPRATALVTELIPHLEARFKLIQGPEGRIVTGHSSGGWSSLWLQLQYPGVFGACFSSAPDPVDFRSFQRTNLYEDASMYTMSDGAETPSYRAYEGDAEVVQMTVRQEASMEHAIHPFGGSGEQWDTWEAMFSEHNPATGLPEQMFDAETGAIDRDVVQDWQQFDIARLVASDWSRYGPIFVNQVHLAVGTHDSFYLNEAVARLKAIVDEKRAGAEGSGYILLVEGATHGSLRRNLHPGWWGEMAAFFDGHGAE